MAYWEAAHPYNAGQVVRLDIEFAQRVRDFLLPFFQAVTVEIYPASTCTSTACPRPVTIA